MTLEGSDAWTNIIETNNESSNVGDNVAVVIVVSANSGSTISFPIIPTKLGSIPITVRAKSTKSSDAVRRHLLVEVSYTFKDKLFKCFTLSNAGRFTCQCEKSRREGLI